MRKTVFFKVIRINCFAFFLFLLWRSIFFSGLLYLSRFQSSSPVSNASWYGQTSYSHEIPDYIEGIYNIHIFQTDAGTARVVYYTPCFPFCPIFAQKKGKGYRSDDLKGRDQQRNGRPAFPEYSQVNNERKKIYSEYSEPKITGATKNIFGDPFMLQYNILDQL